MSTFQPTLLAVALLVASAGAADAAWTEKVLASFKGPYGANPQASLVGDKAGNLYGTTSAGGKFGDGTVFELIPPAAGKTAWQEKVLVSFNGASGANPIAGLVRDATGNLYGTTLKGGAGGTGTVFELVAPAAGHTGWVEKVLASFSGAGGALLQGGVVFDAAGNLYGTTVNGGTAGLGTVFKLTPASGTWTETVLASFDGPHGQYPDSGLVFDTQGNLYGTTVSGGASSDGTVFELAKPTAGKTDWTLSVLTAFDGADGLHPYATPVFDSAGNLYGVTAQGGAHNDGEVYRVSKSGSSYSISVLLSFDGTDGNYPFGGVTLDAAGNLYGTTSGGQKSGDGLVFKLSQSGGKWTETVLASFKGANGAAPSASLIFDTVGNLYGTTLLGGKFAAGAAFKLIP